MLNKMRLLTPGPTPLPETVRLALAKDMIHHRKEQFQAMLLTVEERLKTLFGTAEPVLPLSCSGTGAMTAAVYSLFEPGQKVLVIEAGKFGERWTAIAKSRELNVITLTVDWGKAIGPGFFAKAFEQEQNLAGVLMQASETSTGVMQPVEAIAAITRKSNALLVVDGISAVGISPCPMDKWGIDCLLTGSQKGLMLPPGLALLALSPRAWGKVQTIKPGCFYFDLPAERKNLEKGQTHFTTPVNLIAGLDASLQLLLANGIDSIYAKQLALTMLVRDGVKAMGLELFAQDNFTWGLTSICMPAGIDGKAVLKNLETEFGLVMAGGQDHLKGRIIRFGHMGWVDWGDCIAGLCALASCLARQGWQPANHNYVEVAMAAYMRCLAPQES